VNIRTNIPIVTASIMKKLGIIADKEYLLRPVAFDVITLMTERIHEDGKASDETQIGEYSNSYLKQRQNKYKRTADKKIIVSLTRQLENDWSVIATEKGYGIGFLNPLNFQKATWVEQNKGKTIFKLSEKEKEHVATRLNELIADALNT
jgi:hypothetical protein